MFLVRKIIKFSRCDAMKTEKTFQRGSANCIRLFSSLVYTQTQIKEKNQHFDFPLESRQIFRVDEFLFIFSSMLSF